MAAHQWTVSSVVAGPKLLGEQLMLTGCEILLTADHRLRLQEIAEEVMVSKDSLHAILCMNRVAPF